MGQEIDDAKFTPEDAIEFKRRLANETRILESWFADGNFERGGARLGFELEAWLVDGQRRPAPHVSAVLDALDDPAAVPELAKFNIELNGEPVMAGEHALDDFYQSLDSIWQRCKQTVNEQSMDLAMIGILPTARPSDFTITNMSPLLRYRALNDQVLRLRAGRPLAIDIRGEDTLRFEHDDVMLEAAATSLQLHLKVDPEDGVRYYNASKILSAPVVAVCANSPFLMGRSLWHETRIPLFEQAVAVGASDQTRRVTFGIAYAEHSLAECFAANLHRYPVLLPRLLDTPPETLAHLRLQNGTIWRWNRPLIGFENDRAHLRIEHRVIPSGPTPIDVVANAAFYFGAVTALAGKEEPPERSLSFDLARKNFYAAARYGLSTDINWTDGKRWPLPRLLEEQLLPMAAAGLQMLGLSSDNAEKWLSPILGRIQSGQNGAVWQQRFVARHGRDMRLLLDNYLVRQKGNLAVHTWSTELAAETNQ